MEPMAFLVEGRALQEEQQQQQLVAGVDQVGRCPPPPCHLGLRHAALPLPRLSLSAPTAVAANINPESVASHTVASSAQYSSVLASRDGVPGQMFAAMARSRSPRGTGRGKPPPVELQLAEGAVAGPPGAGKEQNSAALRSVS